MEKPKELFCPMKKFFAFPILVLLLVPLFALFGCKRENSEEIKIVCTIFPQYDWTKNLIAGNGEISLTLLQDSGTDLHSFQPSAADKLKVLSCDLLVYVGGESDRWVEEMLADPSKNPDMKTVKLLEAASPLPAEEQDGQADEHIFLSLKRAHTIIEAIERELKTLDAEHGALYDKNLKEYLEKIDKLEREYAQSAESPLRRVLLFADRFPFRYLADDYNLTCFSAFSGCSAEAEASFTVIKSLAETIDEYALPYVLVLEGSDKKLAERIISSTESKDQTIYFLDSLQSVTKKRIEDGESYLSLMRENLETLRIVLN